MGGTIAGLEALKDGPQGGKWPTLGTRVALVYPTGQQPGSDHLPPDYLAIFLGIQGVKTSHPAWEP